MSDKRSSPGITRRERIDLARHANCAIQGLAAELMRLVRDQHVDSDTNVHHAALGMLATINGLSDDIFGLVFGDPDDEVPRQDAEAIARKLGLEWSAIGDAEVSHG
jgi:hypothetical protein